VQQKEVTGVKMLQSVLKKIGSFLIILLGITFLSFLLSYLSPSDPVEIMMKKKGNMVSEEVIEQKREELGLNQPLVVQYVNWLKGIVKGDFGTSYKSNKPVLQEIQKCLPYTIKLTLLSMFLTIVISTPLGVLCARYKDGWLDNLLRFVTYLFSSLPSFFLALVLMYCFALKLKWFPVIAKGSTGGIVMPALVLSLTLAAWYIRQVRAIVLGELEKEYIDGLLARGVSETKIMFGHVLRNCLMPLVTLVGISFGTMLGGSTIVESIFTWPGVGKMAVDSITSRDYPVIQGYVVWMALIFLFINALVEISYSLLDPRLRKGREEI
jgi:ABC-type dipeptide/oligopeptide/nickel transport system permease component